MSPHPKILVKQEARVAIITINRPEVRNAVDGETADLLYQAFSEFDQSEHLDVAILTGAKGTFCAGADLKAVSEGHGNRVTVEGKGPMGPTRMKLSKPVIAAVEGFAVAGGLELACWCDLRVVAEDAQFGVFCRRWGVPLIDGGTIRLPRLIGHSRAMDMILTGRAMAAAEAQSTGLANRLCKSGQALDEAISLAESLSAFPQLCLRADRLSALDQWSLSENEALAQETIGGLDVIRSGETREGATRFAQGSGRHGAFE